MSKLIILTGLPASGKSTHAKELMEKDGNCVRVNKDLLRTMLHFGEWSGKNEQSIRDAELLLAKSFLTQGRVVIVDDTNLNPKVLNSWLEFVSKEGYKHEIIPITTHYKECIKRDALRENKVGRDVIVGMARRYGLYDNPRRDVICDIDGTLCDISHRLHFVKQDPKDWKSFFSNISKDKPRAEVISKVNRLSRDFTINLVSGRPETCKKETEEWLGTFEIPYDFLLMRNGGDKRQDDIVKKDFLDNYFKKENIELVIDDRPRVIRMWKENGLKVDDVGDGIEF